MTEAAALRADTRSSDGAGGLHVLRERRVLGRVDAIDAAAEHADRPAASSQHGGVRRRIDAARQS